MDARRAAVAVDREREIRRLAALALYLAELEVQEAQRLRDWPREAKAKAMLKASETFAARLLDAGVQVHIKMPWIE